MAERKFEDLGLGSKSASEARILNPDGSFNIRKKNVPWTDKINIYHELITMSWPRFFVVILSGFFIINLLFASIYMMIGVENMTGIETKSFGHDFMEEFFFSTQTLTTLGYGRVAPIGMAASTVAAIESTLGLLGFAMATGLLYGRFSRPMTRLLYSKIGVVAPYREGKGIMFRVANPRDGQLIEIEASMTISLKRPGSNARDFHFLDLERSKVNFLASTWTLVHPLSESSPLKDLSESDFIKSGAEFYILIKAFDESFSQTVYSRTSYLASDLKWGFKFAYIIESGAKESVVDLRRMNEIEPAVLH